MRQRLRYVVKPRPDGGYMLTGERLPYPLRFGDEVYAGHYAHWHGRDLGGVVIYLGLSGYAFSETIETDRPAQPQG